MDGVFESYLHFIFEEDEKFESWDSSFEEEAVFGMKCWSDEDLTRLGRW